MSLKEFKTNASDLPKEDGDTGIQSSLYLQELNTLKIDKLSNRVTIISVLIPVLIGAVLFFICLDIKEQIVDADLSEKNQMTYLVRQSEEKLNALNMRIAKNRFDLDEKLPLLEKKGQSLESQVAILATSKAENADLESGIARLDEILTKHDRRIQNNAVQDKATMAELDHINSSLLSTAARNQEQFENALQAIRQEVTSLGETLDTKITDLQRLRKDLSLLDKQIKEMEKQGITRKELDQRLTRLESDLNQAMKALEKKLGDEGMVALSMPSPGIQPAKKIPPSEDRPLPQPDETIPVLDSISEETLTQ